MHGVAHTKIYKSQTHQEYELAVKYTYIHSVVLTEKDELFFPLYFWYDIGEGFKSYFF